ncbi:MAG: TonB-dependent receptor [Sphingomicrobium sp.]
MAITALPPDPPAIVVTGRGLSEIREDAVLDVIRIDRKRIGQSASGRLEDVLRDVAGLHGFRRSDSRSANATSQSIILRGLGGNASSRAQLILDGVPQSDPFGGWISFPAIAPDRLGLIRVTRGGGSALWGPGAVSGVVELESATPAEVGDVEAGVAIGSRDSVDGRGSLLLSNRNAFVAMSGAFARGDGFIPIVAGDRGPVDRPAPYRQSSGAIRGVVQVAAAIELQANLSAFDDRRDRGVPFTANRGKGFDGSLRMVATGATKWSLLAYGQRRVFASQSASVDPARASATLVNDQYHVPSTGWGARAEIEPRVGPIRLRLGGDARLVRGRTQEHYQFVAGDPQREREAGGRNLTAGAFADATVARGGLVASLAGRVDHWRIGGGSFVQQVIGGAVLNNDVFPTRSGWQPSGRAAIGWHGEHGIGVRGALCSGWRLPTLNELYRPFRVGSDATAANAALQPETSAGGEVGADFQLGPAGSAAVTLFSQRLNHAIANVALAQGPGIFPGVGFVGAGGTYRMRENVDAVDSKGVELDLRGSHGSVNWSLSYAITDARVRASGTSAALDGRRPAQLPRHSGSATLGWAPAKRLNLSLTGRYVSSQFDGDVEDRRLHGTATFDAAASIPLTGQLALDLRAENMFDARVEAARSATDIVERAIPRTLWIGLKFARAPVASSNHSR